MASGRPTSRSDFEIAIICALPLERDAVEALLDEDYEEGGYSYGKAVGDSNAYTIGRIAKQHVVVAHMPGMGTISAAAVAASLKSSFTEIRVALVVGICGGIPARGNADDTDIHLGDVIVSTSIVQIDFGRQFPDGFKRKFDVEDVLGRANPEIRAFVGKLSGYRSRTRLEEKISKLLPQISAMRGSSSSAYLGQQHDIVYPVDHRHKHWGSDCKICSACMDGEDEVCESALHSDCRTLGCQGVAAADGLEVRQPVIHFGRMASGNQVIKSGRLRDRLAVQEKVIGFEMEGAGTWDYVPTIVVKGICDYADSHKSKRWQNYAATTAAACSKAILEEWRGVDRKKQGTVISHVSDTHILSPAVKLSWSCRRSCSGETDLLVGSTLQPMFPVHTTVTRLTNTFFTGRHDILTDLKCIIQEAVENKFQQGPYHIVISGIGGQGKSEICLQIAHQLRHLFWGLFWIDVSSCTLAENGFLNAASRLGVTVTTWESARQELANLKQPWFLVLDNADDPDFDYQPYFPAGLCGIVILTSRNAECECYATKRWIDLEGLSRSDACDLLLRVLRVPDSQRKSAEADAREVARRLHSHPLALIQAGSYISRGHCSLKEYPRVYERQRKRLLEFRPTQAGSRYRDVYATFEASVETLRLSDKTAASDALQLLSLLAMYGSSQLPLLLFQAAWQGARLLTVSEVGCDNLDALTTWHLLHLPPFLQVKAASWDSFRVVEALGLLKALSLVSTESEQDDDSLAVSMHPLIHAWARDRLNSEQQHEFWVQAGCIMALSVQQSNVWHSHARKLQTHLQALVSWPMNLVFGSESADNMCGILLNCALLLTDIQDPWTLLLLMKHVLAHLGLDLSTVTPEWLGLYELTARASLDSGMITDAMELWKQLVEIFEGAVAEDYPGRLNSQHELARAYLANEQVKEAIDILEQIVKIRERVQNEDHPDRLTSQHVLARAYLANEQVKEAIELFEQTVKIRERAQSEDHPERLNSLHELARAYLANAQVKEAIELLKQVVKIRERTLAEDHPDRLNSQHELARAYLANAQVKEAIELFEQIVKTRERVQSEDHPDRLASQHELATARLVDGQTEKAARMLEQVVKIETQKPSESDPRRLPSQKNLAGCHRKLGDRNQAVEMMQQAFDLRDKTLHKHHPDRRRSKAQLDDWKARLKDQLYRRRHAD